MKFHHISLRVSDFEKSEYLLEAGKVKERDLPSFIENYLKSKGASIDPKSQQLIADSIGTDLSRLISELDKLLVAMPENDKRVTPQLVEDQIGVSKDFNGFELRDAVVNRNIFKANQILKFFDKIVVLAKRIYYRYNPPTPQTSPKQNIIAFTNKKKSLRNPEALCCSG